MQSTFRNLALMVLSATGLLTVACGGGTKVVVAPQQNPPSATNLVTPAPSPVVVTVPATPAMPQQVATPTSPGPDYVWVQGYYNWLGDHYVWTPGTWVQSPRPSATWVAAHWEPTSGGYTWVAGHWQY